MAARRPGHRPARPKARIPTRRYWWLVLPAALLVVALALLGISSSACPASVCNANGNGTCVQSLPCFYSDWGYILLIAAVVGFGVVAAVLSPADRGEE